MVEGKEIEKNIKKGEHMMPPEERKNVNKEENVALVLLNEQEHKRLRKQYIKFANFEGGNQAYTDSKITTLSVLMLDPSAVC